MKAFLPSVGAMLLAAACTRSGEPSVDVQRAERIARIEREIAAQQPAKAAWQPLLDAVAKNREFLCNLDFDCWNGDEYGIYDPTELGMLADPAFYQKQPDMPGPVQALADLARQLAAHQIDLLVVVVPAKSALYPEVVVANAPTPQRSNRPDEHLRRLLLAFEREGIEVLDLFDKFVDARKLDVVDDRGKPVVERLYRAQDIHWTSRAASLAADAIAERVRRYPWFAAVSAERGRTVTTEAVSWVWEAGYTPGVTRAIELDPRLHAPAPFEQHALHQVFPVGARLTPQPFVDPASPIVVIGDSFANEYSRDGRHAGLSEHLLRALGFPIDLIAMGHGSCYTARAALGLTRRGLPGKKLVVHELHAVAPHYWAEWKKVDVFGDGDGGAAR